MVRSDGSGYRCGRSFRQISNPARILAGDGLRARVGHRKWEMVYRRIPRGIWSDLMGPDTDVVVRFDKSPIRLVFWQGTAYEPAWVTENGKWYTDEFLEAYGPI